MREEATYLQLLIVTTFFLQLINFSLTVRPQASLVEYVLFMFSKFAGVSLKPRLALVRELSKVEKA